MGRDAELVAVEAAFASSGVDGVVGVVLVGDAGVGRTRLAREVEHRLRRDGGCQVEWVSGLVAPASVAFGAVAHLLPDGIPPDVQPAAVIVPVAQRLTARGGRDRVVLVVDDAQRLDDCSAALVGAPGTAPRRLPGGDHPAGASGDRSPRRAGEGRAGAGRSCSGSSGNWRLRRGSSTRARPTSCPRRSARVKETEDLIWPILQRHLTPVLNERFDIPAPTLAPALRLPAHPGWTGAPEHRPPPAMPGARKDPGAQ